MKDKLLKLIKTKEEARTALVAKVDTSEDIGELRSLNTQLTGLNAEITELRGMIDALPGEDPPAVEPNAEERRSAGSPVGKTQILATYGVGGGESEDKEERAALQQKYEKRGADLKAKRAVTFDLSELPEFRAVSIGGGTLVVPKKYSNTLNETFNEVSSLIDVVNAIPLDGGESYEKGFVVGYGEGDYTTETGDYDDSDPVFDYVSIGKAKITAYTEMSDESMKLPNINYQSLVARNVTIAIRKKIARQIIAGAGGSNAITGIFNAPTKAIPTATDIIIADIDADTLDKIVFGYGGDEDVEVGQYLILNKADLAAFASIRGNDGKKLYTINLNGNVGTISSDGSYAVKFVVNSICPAVTASGTASGTYCMAYGSPAIYEMPIFSQLTVEESRDYKFRSGQIAFRGSVWVGGNVAAYKGFTRIKKA
ncbi:phage major capsid protein [Sporomusa malonica]|uniref:Phage major capsid protein, HK97 family n=1 Tax=Sporomusa malonica TaxID=112901 RepID=A0A1W2AS24_9FIRM|nr:phage major capsid protein [Sporomusa malonica]SMC63322.1 phage major capsid protein, HK97 family [Sporomusa malonica]